jgi:hypothetical protein
MVNFSCNVVVQVCGLFFDLIMATENAPGHDFELGCILKILDILITAKLLV